MKWKYLTCHSNQLLKRGHKNWQITPITLHSHKQISEDREDGHCLETTMTLHDALKGNTLHGFPTNMVQIGEKRGYGYCQVTPITTSNATKGNI